LIAAYPGLAADVFNAFAESKRLYVEKLKAGKIEKLTDVDRMHLRVMEIAGDPLPYGLAPNRRVIDELIRHASTQDIVRQPVTIEDLFAKETRELAG
jgi:4,5-dihydroxyphthalate decarboxylase